MVVAAILTFLINPENLSAQTFGFGASPEFSYRNLVKTDFAPGIDEFIDESNDLSQQIVGYTVGAYFLKPFGRKMLFETGVTYSRDGYNTVLSEVSYEQLINQGLLNSDDPGFDATEEIEFQNRFAYVGIPFRLVYLADGDKVRFTWGLGITPELLIEANTTTTYRFDFGSEESFDGDFGSQPNDFGLTASFSMGVELPLDATRGKALRIEPIVRYGLLPVFDEDAYEVNLFSYGLSLKYFFDLDLMR